MTQKIYHVNVEAYGTSGWIEKAEDEKKALELASEYYKKEYWKPIKHRIYAEYLFDDSPEWVSPEFGW